MISVCLATYNGERFLRPQLDSILSQLGKDDEIVISDDGSTDDTIAIVEEYKDPRIRLIHHNANNVRGTFPLDKVTHNFEYAITHAKGDIIFLADQDDVWMPDKISIMQRALEDADLAMHDCKIADENLQIIEDSYFKTANTNSSIIRNIIHCTFLGCCMAFRRDILNDVLPFPETKVGHDLWIGLIGKIKYKLVFVQKPLLLYRKHDHNMTTAGKKSKYGFLFKINYRLTILHNLLRKMV